MYKLSGKRGFTIVELLIVIVVIGILAAITIVAFSGAQNRAAVVVVQSDLQNAATQLGIDNVNAGTYPASKEAANGGAGLRASPDTTYQYTYDSATNSYCLSATSTKIPTGYNISSATGTVQTGVCSGHSVGGIQYLMVSTLAGSTAGNVNGTGTAAQFYVGPMAIDTNGDIIMAEYSQSRIRRITPAGVTSSFASGMSLVGGIDRDSAGNFYISEMTMFGGGGKVSKITSAGVLSTLAGGTTAGYVDATGTAARFASASNIGDVAVDASGNVYVAETSSHRIRKVTSGGVVTTLAGSSVQGFADGTGTAAQFNGPLGLVTDSTGNLYVADKENNRIRKITSSGVVSTYGGDGTAATVDGPVASARFNAPSRIDKDAAGNLYVVEFPTGGPQKIRKITPSGVVSTIADVTIGSYVDGPMNTARFTNINNFVVAPSGTMYTNSTINSEAVIRKIE